MPERSDAERDRKKERRDDEERGSEEWEETRPTAEEAAATHEIVGEAAGALSGLPDSKKDDEE